MVVEKISEDLFKVNGQELTKEELEELGEQIAITLHYERVKRNYIDQSIHELDIANAEKEKSGIHLDNYLLSQVAFIYYADEIHIAMLHETDKLRRAKLKTIHSLTIRMKFKVQDFFFKRDNPKKESGESQ